MNNERIYEFSEFEDGCIFCFEDSENVFFDPAENLIRCESCGFEGKCEDDIGSITLAHNPDLTAALDNFFGKDKKKKK